MINAGVFVKAFRSVIYYLSSGERRYAVLLFILLFISSLLDVLGLASLVPTIMAAANPDLIYENAYLNRLFTFLGFTSPINFILFLIIGLLVFFVIKNLFIIWINDKQNLFSAKIVCRIVETQYDKYSNLPYLDFNKLGSSKIVNSTINIPAHYIVGVVRPLFSILSEITVVAVILLAIIFFKPILFVILLVVIGPTAFFTFVALKNKSQKMGDALNEIRPQAHKVVIEAFMGYIELKLANKKDDFKQRLSQMQQACHYYEAKSYLFTQIPLRVIEIVSILGIVTIFLYSFFFSNNPQLILTIIGLFAAAAYRLMPSVNRILTSLVALKQNEYTIDDLERYRESIDLTQAPRLQTPLKFTRAIEFQNVTFTYPGTTTPTLRDLNLTIKKGEKVGIIGSSGSGKTTVINILLRFILEVQGQVVVDGVPLTSQNIKAWHKLIGYVKQDTFLMEASIKDNITLGAEIVDPTRMQYAVEQASLQEFIQSLPDGLETQVGERGSTLSGGQRQRIGIARALYKDTKVLLLDEATSALDNETEKEVSEAIKRLSHTDITVVMIAHRITTLKDCDRILELKDGQVVAEHNYTELIQQVI